MTSARRSIALVTLLSAFVISACGGGDERPGPSPRDRAAANVCDPPRAALGLDEFSESRLRRAARGTFRVYGFRTELEPPVDWGADPHESLRFQADLSSWEFMDPLIAGYQASGERRYLRGANELALDWIEANPRGAPAGGVGTWSGKIAGDRAPRLAYLLRAQRCAGLLAPEQVAALRRSLREHVEILLGPESAGDTNHALYVQVGLAAVSRQLPGLARADEIRATAERRFRRVLEARLGDGVWLEHSTSYQFLAIRVVERFLSLVGRNEALESDLRGMRRAAAWLTAPDGLHSLFGDSRALQAPPALRRLARRQAGLKVFPNAGFAAVRRGGSQLLVAAGFHNTTHKHADELSFELSEGGRRLVSDTGMYHKDPGAIRDFVVSAQAHSTLTVDDADFPVGDPGHSYGSGIRAWGSGGGWHAVLARNPLLADQGAAHSRLFLYRPGRALIVADRVRGHRPHLFERRVQLAPGVRVADVSGAVAELTAPGFSGAVFDAGSGVAPELVLARGRDEPLAGYTSPAYREWQPRTTITLASEGSTLTRALTLALDESRLHAAAVRPRRDGGFVVRLTGAEGGGKSLSIARAGTSLSLRESASR